MKDSNIQCLFKKTIHKRIYAKLFHLYEVQYQRKLIYVDISQKNS